MKKETGLLVKAVGFGSNALQKISAAYRYDFTSKEVEVDSEYGVYRRTLTLLDWLVKYIAFLIPVTGFVLLYFLSPVFAEAANEILSSMSEFVRSWFSFLPTI